MKKCITRDKPCDETKIVPNLCFVSIASSAELNQIKKAIIDTLHRHSIEEYIAEDVDALNQDLFCEKICSKILQSRFCIMVLTEACFKGEVNNPKPNPNVYFEYGMATVIGKKIIPLYPEPANAAPFNIRGLGLAEYSSDKTSNKYIEKVLDKQVKGAIRNTTEILALQNGLGSDGGSLKIDKLGGPLYDKAKEYYDKQGLELAWPLLSDKDNKVVEGYQIATFPGTKREIWAGYDRTRDKYEHILMTKPQSTKRSEYDPTKFKTVLEIYDSIKQFIANVQMLGSPNIETLHELLRGTKYVEVIFEDDEIKKYIALLHRKGLDLEFAEREFQKYDNSEKREKWIKKTDELFQWFCDQHRVAEEMFKPYLNK
ncbi:MAG: nucleotide-binding protein [Candidatus Omnitrophica bacterium]|nr:nucleotide-binding protein [Candidatus Omnitrophota bacterium]